MQGDQNAGDTRHNKEMAIDALKAIKSGKRLDALAVAAAKQASGAHHW